MARTRPIHIRVREHVDAAGLSIADVARLTGWKYLHTMRLLNGDVRITADDMEVLALVLRTTVGELYRGRRKARAA